MVGGAQALSPQSKKGMLAGKLCRVQGLVDPEELGFSPEPQKRCGQRMPEAGKDVS